MGGGGREGRGRQEVCKNNDISTITSEREQSLTVILVVLVSGSEINSLTGDIDWRLEGGNI